jgi:hypothetical protein
MRLLEHLLRLLISASGHPNGPFAKSRVLSSITFSVRCSVA